MKLIATPTIDSYFKFPDPYKDANDCVSQQGCGRIDRRCYHQNVTHQHASDHGTNPFSVAVSFTDWGKGMASESVRYTVYDILYILYIEKRVLEARSKVALIVQA